MGQSSLQEPPPTCSLPTATDPCAPLDLDDGTAKKKKKRGLRGLGSPFLRQCVTRPAGAERESLFPVLTPITHKVLILYDRCHHHPSPHHPLSGPRQPPVFLSSLPHNYDNSPPIPSSFFTVLRVAGWRRQCGRPDRNRPSSEGQQPS